MTRQYLAFVLMGLVVVSLAISSQSMLTEKRGADYVFYGAERNHFLGEQLTIGDFNNDGLEDAVSTIDWDDPGAGGWQVDSFSMAFACDTTKRHWEGVVRMWKGDDPPDTINVCYFGDPVEDPGQQAAWVADGWTIIDTVWGCDACLNAGWLSENQGAALVMMGDGVWSGAGPDINLATGGQDYIVAADEGGDEIHNGFAAGDVDGNGADELVLGAPKLLDKFGPGSVYVVRDNDESAYWPSPPATIRVPSDSLVTHVFKGQRYGDQFGKGVLVADLDGNPGDEIIVAAPAYDGPDSTRLDAGAVYIFYSSESLPITCDLSGDTTGTGAYLQVILGPASAHLGVTELQEVHVDGDEAGYDPVGLTVGDWDGDGSNDLAIGAGAAEGGYGAVYVIFGRDPQDPVKLQPGYTIDLAKAPGIDSTGAADVRLTGCENSKFGAGVAFCGRGRSQSINR